MINALVLAIAMVLDAIAGEPRWLWSRVPHPAILLGKCVASLERGLNSGTNKRLKGIFALIVLVILGWAVGSLLSLCGPIVEILCAAILLAYKSLVDHVDDVASGLRLSPGEGRRAVSRIVSRDVSAMSEAQIARSAIESAAENMSDGVIAPAFWFLIGGLPALLVYKAVNTADSMIGYRTTRYHEFGWAAARFDDVLNLIPARLTGLIIAASNAGLPQWRAISRDARQHRSPNAGWPEAAMARAIDVALAGPRSYDGQIQDLAWVNGDGRKQIDANDIDASLRVLRQVWCVSLILIIAVASTAALPLDF